MRPPTCNEGLKSKNSLNPLKFINMQYLNCRKTCTPQRIGVPSSKIQHLSTKKKGSRLIRKLRSFYWSAPRIWTKNGHFGSGDPFLPFLSVNVFGFRPETFSFLLGPDRLGLRKRPFIQYLVVKILPLCNQK